MTESALARERATLSCAIVPSGSEMQSANSWATCKTHHWCHNTADIQVAPLLHKSVRGKQIEDRQEMIITILYAGMSKAVQKRQGSIGKSSMILIPCNSKDSSQTAIQLRPMNHSAHAPVPKFTTRSIVVYNKASTNSTSTIPDSRQEASIRLRIYRRKVTKLRLP